MMLATQICEDGDGAGGSVSSGCVSGPRRLRCGAVGATLRGQLLGGCRGGRGPGAVESPRCFSSDSARSRTGGSGNLLVGDRPSRVRELCPCGGDDSFGSPIYSIRQISWEVRRLQSRLHSKPLGERRTACNVPSITGNGGQVGSPVNMSAHVSLQITNPYKRDRCRRTMDSAY